MVNKSYRMFTLIVDGQNLGRFKVPYQCLEIFFFRRIIHAAEKKLGEHLPQAKTVEIRHGKKLFFFWRNEKENAWTAIQQLAWP